MSRARLRDSTRGEASHFLDWLAQRPAHARIPPHIPI